jgi:hypothetical protein
MWKVKVINWVTNLFGGIAGVAQMLEGVVMIQAEQYPQGIAKLLEGAGIFVIGYFTGKSAMNLTPEK